MCTAMQSKRCLYWSWSFLLWLLFLVSSMLITELLNTLKQHVLILELVPQTDLVSWSWNNLFKWFIYCCSPQNCLLICIHATLALHMLWKVTDWRRVKSALLRDACLILRVDLSCFIWIKLQLCVFVVVTFSQPMIW